MQETRVGVKPWKPVPRARDELEQLWYAVYEIKHLGCEKKQQCFAVMPQDARHCKRHARKVGECITHKHLDEYTHSNGDVYTQACGDMLSTNPHHHAPDWDTS